MEKKLLLTIVLAFLICAQFVFPAKEPPYKAEKIAGNVYCLYGPGGNMSILKTAEGLLVVDSKYNHTLKETQEELKKISPKPVQVHILTHYHWDHSGGFKAIGKNALVLSQEKCKASLKKRSKRTDQEAISRIKTYEKEKTLSFGKEKITLLHMKPAHTSGDTIVIYHNAKVIHTGDLFFHDIPPYIDVKDGADTQNWINVIEDLCKKYPEYTFIPGHGKSATAKEFLHFAQYLRYLREQVLKCMKEGKTAKEAMEAIKFDNFPNMKDQGNFANKNNNILWIYQEFEKKTKSK